MKVEFHSASVFHGVPENLFCFLPEFVDIFFMEGKIQGQDNSAFGALGTSFHQGSETRRARTLFCHVLCLPSFSGQVTFCFERKGGGGECNFASLPFL